MSRDPLVTAYIQRAAPFARPILRHLRSIVHSACPKVEERLRWNFPHFDYNGKMMCSMAAFKEHATFGFWYASQLKDSHRVMQKRGTQTAMGHFGRLTTVKDLPRRNVLLAYVKEAARILEDGPSTTATRNRSSTKKRTSVPRLPSFVRIRLKKNAPAYKTYKAFSPSHKKEYIEWISEAKTASTRERRLKAAIEWMAEGKTRNWKYMKRA